MATVTRKFRDDFEAWAANRVATGEFTSQEMDDFKDMLRRDLAPGQDQLRAGQTVILASGVEMPATIDAAGGDGAKDANGTSARKYYKDVATDRHGLTAAYSLPAMPTAMANASAPAAPSLPAMPSIAEAPPIIDPMASTGGKPVVAVASTQDVGQDIRDRRIAHVVTGGLS